MDWLQIVLTVLPIILGVGLIWTRVEKVLAAFAELAEALTVISEALSDKKLTAEEIVNIKKEISEAVAAFTAIFKK